MSVIEGSNVFGLMAILFGLAFIGFWADRNKFASRIPGVVWILLIGIFLSNIGFIPLEAPIYNYIGGYIMPLGIPLLLYRANIRQIFSEGGMVLPIFVVASLGTAIAAVLGFFIFDLGGIGAKVAATYGGTFIGGMVNFIAISEITELSKTEFSALLSPSAPVSIIALMILVMLPSLKWFQNRFTLKDHGQFAEKDGSEHEVDRPEFRLRHTTAAIGLSALICAGGNMIANYFDLSNYSLFFITLITVILANVFPKQLEKLSGDFELGMICMYLFFAMIGAGTDFTSFAGTAPIYFMYGMFIIVFHIAFVLLFAKIFKWDLGETVIASGAALVGSAATAGIASSKGWKNMVTPAITIGMLGYVVANFIGITIYNLLS